MVLCKSTGLLLLTFFFHLCSSRNQKSKEKNKYEGVVFKKILRFLRYLSKGRIWLTELAGKQKVSIFISVHDLDIQRKNSHFQKNVTRASQRYLKVLYFLSERLKALTDSLRQKKLNVFPGFFSSFF